MSSTFGITNLFKYLINMKLIKLFLACVMFMSYSIVDAKNADVFGSIKDKSTNETLPGATLLILGTPYATITDIDGKFHIRNLKPGNYTLKVSFIGFQEKQIDLELKSGEQREINIEMEVDAISVDEVIVTAQLLGQKRAINQQLNADALVNIVSSDKIEELPDVNAAEAIGRLPGISVNRSGGEANKVTVRGLSPKLTNVSVNGVKIAPSSNSITSADRSVDLSTISSDVLSTIEVYKAPTADMDGDAIGGIVNLGVAKAPERGMLKIKTQGGYNSFVNQLSNYKGTVDYGHRFFDNKFGILTQINLERVNRTSQTVSNSYNTDYVDSDERWPLSNVKIQEDLRIIDRIGGSMTLDYDYRGGSVAAQMFYTQKNGETETNYQRINYGSEVRHYPRYTKSKFYTAQGILSGDQELGPITAEWTAAYSNTTNDNYFDVELYLQELSGSVGTGDHPYTVDDMIESRTYNYGQGHLSQYVVEPELTQQENITAALDLKHQLTIGNDLSITLKAGGKLSVDTRESTHEYMFNPSYYLQQEAYDQAIQLWSDAGHGNLLLNDNGNIAMANFYETGASTTIWDGAYELTPYVAPETIVKWHDAEKSTLYENMAEDFRKYDLTERVYAGYAMIKINYSDWFTLIPGVRYEHSDNEYHGHYSSIVQNTVGGTGIVESGEVIDTSSTQNYGVLLPSFHMKIKPNDWFDLRLSAVKTLARPDYTMIVPKTRVNTKEDLIWRGNPDLKHSEAWGYDATVSFYSNSFGLFSIGGFYKQFDNYFTRIDGYDISAQQAVELGFADKGYHIEENYENFDGSEVYGFEMDIQTNLSFLPSPFNGIIISANLTRLWSKTYVPKYEPVEIERVGRETYYTYDTTGYLYESVLPDQVELAGNVMLGYDYKDFSCRFSLVTQSASLKSLGTETLNVEKFKQYSDAYIRLDASASQKIGDHFKVMLNISNLTGESERSYTYDPKYWTKENKYGMSFDLGIQYKL